MSKMHIVIGIGILALLSSCTYFYARQNDESVARPSLEIQAKSYYEDEQAELTALEEA